MLPDGIHKRMHYGSIFGWCTRAPSLQEAVAPSLISHITTSTTSQRYERSGMWDGNPEGDLRGEENQWEGQPSQ
jgi:hypothetical protein